MSMSKAMRQMPAPAGRAGAARGEAAREPASDEADGPRHEPNGTGNPHAALLHAAFTRENLQRALKRVRANKGAAGVDGLDMNQTATHLITAWPVIREQLLLGTYRPSPVRRVTIPKSDGGERELGIPTVTDRVIQQALLQVLQPILDPTFSEHSYGFRPGRRAQDAVLAAQAHVQAGRRVVVDVDLEKFFDRVHHDILIDRLSKRLGEVGVIRLIRAYLDSGIMSNGVVQQRYQGTPQGGPLSPLLANVMLDDVDKELERRGHCFVRYADDCERVRSQSSGGRAGDGAAATAIWKTATDDQRSQECGGERIWSQIPGLQLVGSAWKSGPTACGRQTPGDVQAAGASTDAPQRRAQHASSGARAAALPAGLEGVLRTGANAQCLARAGRVAAPQVAGHPAQAMQTRHDHLPRTARVGSQARGCQNGGGQQPTLVAQQRDAAQQRPDHCLV